MKKWTLNPGDVQWKSTGSSSKHGRAPAKRHGIEITLTHIPTGVSVTGTTPVGNYTRNEMATLRRALGAQLFQELERKVAVFLRIPGR